MIGDFHNRFSRARIEQQPEPQITVNRGRARELVEPEGIGQMGGQEVGLKQEPNERLLWRSVPKPSLGEHWTGRIELVGGRKKSEIGNESAKGLVRIQAEGGAKVDVVSVDKPIDRMVDRGGLIGMLGRAPSPDRKLLGLIRLEGSPHYAKALRRIDSFHAAMNEPVPANPKARGAKFKEMQEYLQSAQRHLIEYAKAHPDNKPMRDGIGAALGRIREELALLSSVAKEDNQEFLQRHTTEGRPFTWKSAANLLAGVTEASKLDYDDSRLDRARSRDGLGSGANGTVDLVVYDDGSEWIFKPDRLVNPMRNATAEKMGIDLSDPRQGDRIICTGIVDSILTPPRREGDPEPSPREGRRAIHNGQLGVLVPVAKGSSMQDTHFAHIESNPGQIGFYESLEPEDLQQMKVRRLTDVDVAMSVRVPPDRLPDDVEQLDRFDLSQRYGLTRETVWLDGDGVEVTPEMLRERGLDMVDDQTLIGHGLAKGTVYETEKRPLLDQRSRELAQRFDAPIEHQDVAFQRMTSRNYRVDTHDPDLRRQLNMRECMDFVNGNHDRHPGNYKLEIEEGRLVRLNAYDDDETFPEFFDDRVVEQGYIRRTDDGDVMYRPNGEPERVRAGHEVGLPVVMDREFAEHLLTLDWTDFQALSGKLPDKALEVAKTRFELLQNHARTLGEQGRLIDRHPEDGGNQWEDGNWAGQDGSSLHQLLSDSRTSYVGKLIEQNAIGETDMPGLPPRGN